MNIRFIFLAWLLLLAASPLVSAQSLLDPAARRNNREPIPNMTCVTDQVHENMMRQSPDYARRMEQFEISYREAATRQHHSQPLERQGGDPVLTIPVVVHIVHRTGIPIGTDENLTDAAVTAVINQVNDRYAHASGLTFTNPHSGTDTDIELCLVQRDPAGNFTTGIVRHADNVLAENNYDTNNTQNTYFWNTTQYMNIYITHSINSATSGGIAGYSTLAGSHGSNNDGAVFVYTAWWSGLLAHEAGHYFNLNHNFDGGCPNGNCLTNGDRVCDTPPKATPGGAGAGCSPSNSCDTDDDDLSTNNPFRPVAAGGLGDITDSNENYMDYSGGCWSAYTVGQRLRMRTAITTTRASLLANNFCFFTNNDSGISAIINPTGSTCVATFTPTVTLRNFGAATLTSVDIIAQVNGVTAYTYAWTGALAPDATTNVTLNNITLPTNGIYTVSFATNNPNGGADGYPPNNASQINVAYGGLPLPYTQNFEGAFVPTGWTRLNPENNTTWQQIATACNGNSAYVDNFNYNGVGNLDHLVTQLIGLTNYQTASLAFDVAYAPYSATYFDGLRVSISTDCGATYVDVYDRSGATLGTVPASVTVFSPADCTQWRTETVNLNAYVGNNIIVRFTNVNGWGNNIYLDNINLTGTTATPGVRVQAKAFLEGPYNAISDNMTTALRGANAIPVNQPYNVAPWNYAGTETAAVPPTDATDWVLLDILNASMNVVARRAAFVRNDGQLIDTDGTLGVLFTTGLTAGTAYTLVLRHRNHLPVMSTTTVTLPNAAPYDFTALANVSGTQQSKLLETNIYGLWAADYLSNGIVSFGDYNGFAAQSGQVGYLGADFNLDGNVGTADFTLYSNNAGRIALPSIR